jgi:uncharacterized membrane protein YdbT with pleckstrin-like domain
VEAIARPCRPRAGTLIAVGIPESHLHRDERIVLDLHPHWVMMAKAVIALMVTTALGIFLWVSLDGDGTWETVVAWVGILLIVVSLLWFAQRWITWYSTNFVVTTDRCIYRSGVISKKGIEIPLERINTVFFEQGLMDRLVRAGTLMIESAGEMGRQTFRDVKNPIMVQNVLYQEMEDNENRKFDRIRGAGGGASTADEIAKLAALRDQGHLTDAEFEAQKASLLNPPGQPGQPG